MFSKEWEFNHVKSSPHYPGSNGLTESVVKSVKEGVVCLIIHKLSQRCIQLIFGFVMNRCSHVSNELSRISEGMVASCSWQHEVNNAYVSQRAV